MLIELDKSRKYSIQEKTLVGLLLQAFGLNNTVEGNRLKGWKKVHSNFKVVGQGDLGTVVSQVFSNRYSSSLELSEVGVLLHELALTSPWSTVERNGVHPRPPVQIISSLFRQESICCKWIARIILKNLFPINLSWQDFFHAYHPLMVSIYSVRSDLHYACVLMMEVIQNGHSWSRFYEQKVLRLDYFLSTKREYCTPQIFTFISCMDCIQAKSIFHVYEEMHRQELQDGMDFAFYSEVKYDGERMQIHIQDNQLQIFSKSGRNSTQDRVLAHDIILQSLASEFHNVLTNRVESRFNCILEAELLVFDHANGAIERFGGVQSFRFGHSHSASPRGLYVVFYDVLYLNDHNLLFAPYVLRRKQLELLVKQIPKKSQISQSIRITIPIEKSIWTLDSLAYLKTLFLSTIAEGKEGLIAKSSSSTYRPGQRTHWMKIKPDYMRGLGDCGEYCLIGGSWAPSNVFLGLRLEDAPYLMNTFFVGALLNKSAYVYGADIPEFKIVFTVTAGFSRELLLDFCLQMSKKRKPFQLLENVTGFRVEKDLSTPSMDWIFESPQPVTLKGSSFERLGAYGRWVLRHPRLVRICGNDIEIGDTISYAELQQLGKDSENMNTQEAMDLKEHLDGLDLEQLEIVSSTFQNGSETPSLSETCSQISSGSISLEPVDPRRCWVYKPKSSHTPFPAHLNSCTLTSPTSMFKGCGWDCNRTDHDVHHREGIMFVHSGELENIEAILRDNIKGTCSYQKSLYLVDVKWLSAEKELIGVKDILQVIHPFV
jgi:ATP-dependent DNA ligase